jgi:regulator of nucleoside diphosphate kinase
MPNLHPSKSQTQAPRASKGRAADALVVSREDYERLTNLIERYQHGRFAALAADLDDELARATLVDAEAIPPDIVRMNGSVVFRFADTGESREVTVVYPEDADVEAGRISVLAPIGTALLGLGVGQRIQWPTPEGVRPLEVMAVRAAAV